MGRRTCIDDHGPEEAVKQGVKVEEGDRCVVHPLRLRLPQLQPDPGGLGGGGEQRGDQVYGDTHTHTHTHT